MILTGDFRELSKGIEDESIDLILTDPVYDQIDDYRDLARLAARILKINGSLLTYYGIGYLPETLKAMENSTLHYRWQGIWYQSNRAGARGGFGFVVYSPFLWFEKGRAKIYQRTNDVVNGPIPSRRKGQYHKWNKRPEVLIRYIEALTKPGDLVYDPFTGGGTTGEACIVTGREFIGHEIDPEATKVARLRLANAVPMWERPEVDKMLELL